MNFKIVMLVVGLLVSQAHADFSGVIYEKDSQKKKELFKIQIEEKSADKDNKGADASNKESTVKSIFKDTDGNIALEQTVLLRGDDLVRDEVEQKQLGQKGLIEVKDDEIFFSKTVKGETKVKKEKKGETLVSSGNFQRFVRSHWSEIEKGSSISFRFAVWDRQETVGFEIFKIGEEKINDKPVLVLKMKPSSFLIAALVKPLIFKFAADGSQLVEMTGRVAPKQKKGDDYKDLDAEVVYTY
jgi:hypothetical protein